MFPGEFQPSIRYVMRCTFQPALGVFTTDISEGNAERLMDAAVLVGGVAISDVCHDEVYVAGRGPLPSDSAISDEYV